MKKKSAISILIATLVSVIIFGLLGCNDKNETLTDNIVANCDYYDVWDGSEASGFKYGDGTVTNPYQISTGAELAYFAKLINEGNKDYNKACFCLVNSIDLNGQKWTPIGSATYDPYSYPNVWKNQRPFYGVFNGKNCIIKNYEIANKGQMIGFFGYIKNATIKNIGLHNFSIVARGSNNKYVGGLVGRCNESTIKNCFVSGEINCSNGSNTYVGGLTGTSTGEINNCFSIGSIIVRSSDIWSGGLVGSNYSELTNSYSKCQIESMATSGTVYSGGLVGGNGTLIKNCYTISDVKAAAPYDSCVGGLVGYTDNNIENSYAIGNINASVSQTWISVGGLIGEKSDNVNLTNCYRCNSQQISVDAKTKKTNELGNVVSIQEIKSNTFQAGLGFGNAWVLKNNEHPSVKGLPITYTVEYSELNAHTSYIALDVFKAEVFEKDGYVFNGWSLDDELVTDNNGNFVQSFKLSSDITLKPKHSVKDFNANFYADNELIKSVTFTIEDDIIDEPNVPSKNGYSGEWESYTISANDITINAKYEPIEYSITYNDEGALNNNTTKYTVESSSFELNAVSKTGYTFDGWYLDIEYTQPIQKIEKGTFGDLLVFAKFIANEYKLKLDSNGGTIYENQEIRYGNQYQLPTPLKHGYTFKGWKIYGTFITDNLGNSLSEWDYTYTQTATAQWEIVEYAINYYNCKTAVNSNSFSYTIEDENFNLQPLELSGYEFMGWFSDEELEKEIKCVDTSEATSYDIFASWSIIQYNIVYANTKGFDNPNPITYTVETDTIDLADIGIDGYTFCGWFNGDSKIESVPIGTTGDINLSARWNDQNYIIELTGCDADVWDGEAIAGDFYGGNGTFDNPYIINSAAQFIYFIKSTNTFKSKYIELYNSIDLNSVILKSGKQNFAGHFNGNNFSVLNVVIEQATTSTLGLFNTLSGDGSITNLDVNITINSAINGATVGGIAGKVLGSSSDDSFVISHVSVSGDINVKYNSGPSSLVGGGAFGAVKYAVIDTVDANVNVDVRNETTSSKSGYGLVNYTDCFGKKGTTGAYYTFAGGFVGQIIESIIDNSKAKGSVKSIITRTNTSNVIGTNEGYDRRSFCGGFAGLAGNNTFQNSYAISALQAKAIVYNYYASTSSFRCHSLSWVYCGGFIGSTTDGNSYDYGNSKANYCYFDGTIDCYSYAEAAGDPQSSGNTMYNYERSYVYCGGFCARESSTLANNCSAKASVSIYSSVKNNVTTINNDWSTVIFYGFSYSYYNTNNRYYIYSLNINANTSSPNSVQSKYDNVISSGNSNIFSYFTDWEIIDGRYELTYEHKTIIEVSYGGDFILPTPDSESFLGWFAIINGKEEQVTDRNGNSLQNSALLSSTIEVYPKYAP